MASYGDVLAAFRDFSIALASFKREEFEAIGFNVLTALKAKMGGGYAAFETPLLNVHAIGIGIRITKGKIYPKDFVLKVFVYDKQDLGSKAPKITRSFGGFKVDVESLPVLKPLLKKKAAKKKTAKKKAVIKCASAHALAVANPILGQNSGARVDPIVGGVSITPLNRQYVGTLGCFLKRNIRGSDEWFVLSNNHVLADVDRLSLASIAHPGSASGVTNANDVFAEFREVEGHAVPILFPGFSKPEPNQFDAAIARVTDLNKIDPTKILGIANYKPDTIVAAVPGMRVVKSGQTTGRTIGCITAHIPASANETIDVEYGPSLVATFRDVFAIRGEDGKPFSSFGDSGSLVLTEDGNPVGLLFAGLDEYSFACDFHGVCSKFNAFPV